MIYKVLILTEAGKKIGLGHYMRCKSIYQELLNCNIKTQLIIHSQNFLINDQNIIVFDWINNLRNLKYNKSQIVIIDSYLANEDIYNQLRLFFYKVFVLDDYNRIEYNADVLINTNVYFSKINYSNQNIKCFGGKEFVILRPEFLNNSLKNSYNLNIKTILITLGGSDYRNMNFKLVNLFLELTSSNVIVIAPENKKINVTNSRLSIYKLQNVSEMLYLFSKADLVVSGCGQILHELAYLSKPTIGISIDYDQILNQRYYLKKNFLLKKINWNDKDLNQKIFENYLMLQDLKNRLKIKKNSDNFNYTNGTKNVIKLIKLYI